MKIIKVSNGNECLVDDEDYEELSKNKWYYSTRGYIVRDKKIDGKRKTIPIHRQIMKVLDNPSVIVDHKNMNTFDNRKENLRICNKSQYMTNRREQNNNSSGYKGVVYSKEKRRWKALICLNQKRIHIGYYDTPEEAALEYDKKAKELHGEFARTNSMIGNL